MDEGKVLLVNLAKGNLGEDTANLLGSLLISRFDLAALSRANIPENERRPFYLYADEFHNFTTQSISGMLSELRKYRLSMTLSGTDFRSKLRRQNFGIGRADSKCDNRSYIA